jgi:hypothetical protein
VLGPGTSRQRLARTLNSAYAEGLLSEDTLAHRLDILFASTVVDPVRLVGDLTQRMPRRRARPRGALTPVKSLSRLRRRSDRAPEAGILLALDWTGAQTELLIGRDHCCDVVIEADTVSARHARLIFRDGGWTVQDLESTNGTWLNGNPVGRCRLRAGDQLLLADQPLRVD